MRRGRLLQPNERHTGGHAPSRFACFATRSVSSACRVSPRSTTRPDPAPAPGERVRDLKANKSTGEYVLHDASALTALDPPFKRPAAVNGVTALGPRYQCSNCQMRGSICEIDAIGLYFRSFQRHVDREPATSTVCADCGRLAVPRAIHGNLPICSGCHKKRQTTRKEAKCFACHARIHPAAVRVTAPVVPAFGFYTHPQAETFCHSCSRVADPKLPCSKQEIKSLTQSF